MPELTANERGTRGMRSGRVPSTEVPSERIADFCQRWGIWRLGVFGSVVRDDFGPDSDIDFLVDYDPERKYTIDDLLDMKDEMKEMFGREVDLVSRSIIERSENYLRRELIFETTEIIYEKE